MLLYFINLYQPGASSPVSFKPPIVLFAKNLKLFMSCKLFCCILVSILILQLPQQPASVAACGEMGAINRHCLYFITGSPSPATPYYSPPTHNPSSPPPPSSSPPISPSSSLTSSSFPFFSSLPVQF